MNGLSRAATVALGLAAFGTALMAGFFFAFAVDVAPAMAQLDAERYVLVQQLINRTVRNAAFGAAYFGTPLVMASAAVASWLVAPRTAAVAASLALAIYAGGVIVVTSAINLPINTALAGWLASAPPAEWVDARDRWNEANMLRTVAAALAALLTIFALVSMAVRSPSGKAD